jgi:hypothetical protein
VSADRRDGGSGEESFAPHFRYGIADPPIRLPLHRHRSVEIIHSVEVLERIDHVFLRKEDILYSNRRTVA